MTTKKQIKANKKNAQKSTGPKDTSKTIKNSYKHGLTSDTVFCNLHQKWINNFTEDFKEHFKPRDIMENLLVEKMAICWFRMHKSFDTEQHLYGEEFKKAVKSEIYRSSMNNEQPTIPKTVFVPLTEQNELIQRYETSSERSFYRALKAFNEGRGIFTKQSHLRGASNE